MEQHPHPIYIIYQNAEMSIATALFGDPETAVLARAEHGGSLHWFTPAKTLLGETCALVPVTSS